MISRFATFLGILLWTTVVIGQTEVLFVINDPPDAAGNQSIIDRLEQEFGFNVTVMDDDSPRNPQASDAEGKALVVITSTVLSGNVGTAFTDQDPLFASFEIPTIQWEQALHDEFLFADSGVNVDGDTIEITEEGAQHFLAAGLGPGDVQVREGSTQFHISSTNNLAEGYQVIARIGNDPALGVVEPGGVLNNGTTATARRIDMFWGDSSIDGATDEGLMLFDAAINYALGGLIENPGDFNQDGQVDLLDFAIMVENFHQRVETHEQGDMDLNRSVNLADFIAFRTIFQDQAGGGGAAASVPEPESGVLFLVAGLAIAGFRRRRR